MHGGRKIRADGRGRKTKTFQGPPVIFALPGRRAIHFAEWKIERRTAEEIELQLHVASASARCYRSLLPPESFISRMLVSGGSSRMGVGGWVRKKRGRRKEERGRAEEREMTMKFHLFLCTVYAQGRTPSMRPLTTSAVRMWSTGVHTVASSPPLNRRSGCSHAFRKSPPPVMTAQARREPPRRRGRHIQHSVTAKQAIPPPLSVLQPPVARTYAIVRHIAVVVLAVSGNELGRLASLIRRHVHASSSVRTLIANFRAWW